MLQKKCMMAQEKDKTQEELIDEAKKKVKKLKSLLKQATSLGCDVQRAIEDQIDYHELEIKRMQNHIIFDGLIGKCWKYCEKRNQRNTEYLYVRNIIGDDFVADIIAQSYWWNNLETHIYNKTKRSCSVYELCYFTEITMEEFRNAYEEITKNALNILKEQEK